jgi:hypothetical protein
MRDEDAGVRLAALVELIRVWPDETTMQVLLDRGTKDPDEHIRRRVVAMRSGLAASLESAQESEAEGIAGHVIENG